jgi:hypothetical protein
VHANDHRSRCAFARDAFDDSRGCAMSFAQSPDFFSADQSQQTGLAHRINRGSRKSACGIYFRGRGRDDFYGNSLDALEPGA